MPDERQQDDDAARLWAKLDAIHHQVSETNGRVSALERQHAVLNDEIYGNVDRREAGMKALVIENSRYVQEQRTVRRFVLFLLPPAALLPLLGLIVQVLGP